MKKIILLVGLGVFSAYSSALFAQSPFTFGSKETSQTTLGTEGDDELILPNTLRNTSESAFKFKWRFLNPDDKPATWILSGFCDNNTCYTSGWQAGETKESFDVLPGTESDFKLQMKLPVETAENTTASFRFEAKVEVDGETFIDTAIYIVTKNPTGVNIIEVDDSRINVFPNPTIDNNVTIFIAKELQAKHVFVYDMMGRLVVSQEVTTSEFQNLDVSNFNTGLHMIQIINQNNEVLSVRKLFKR